MPSKQPVITDLNILTPGKLYRAALDPDTYATGLVPAETRGRPRTLSLAETRMVQHWHAQGHSQRRLAKDFGCSVRAIRTATGAP
jgi:hypothetical protein